MEETTGEVNASSTITLLSQSASLGRFILQPITGKTHQLRLHMMKIGVPILNDKFYPTLLPELTSKDDSNLYKAPLQLLAKRLSFVDPITEQNMIFESNRCLESW